MSRLALWELHFANILLSSALLFSRWIEAPVPFVIAARCVVASAALWIFLRLFGDSGNFGNRVESGPPGALSSENSSTGTVWNVLTRRNIVLLILSGLLLGGHWISFFYSGRLSSIALAVVAMHTYPLISALIEPWLEGNVDFRKYRTDVLLAFIAFSGIAYMGSATLERDGLLLGLLAAALITARNLVVRRGLTSIPGARIMLWQISAAGLFLLPALFLYPVYFQYSPSLSDLTLILLLGLLITAVAHTLLTRAVVKMSARTTGIIASVQPLYSALAAFFFFDEVPSRATFLGGGLVLGSAMIESYRFSRRVRE